MINEDSFPQLKQVLDQAGSSLVVLGPKASQDQVASAIALFRGLKNLGKEVGLVSPEEIEIEEMLGLDDVRYKLGNKDLSISFDYNENSVDKVSYHIDEEKNKFYLVIKPKKGQPPLDSGQVSFDYVGAQADLIFLFGVHQYSSLEHLYENYADVYDSATVITIHNFEPEIGNLKLDISGKSCWSESMVELLEGLGLGLDSEGATNLLSSIENATNRLSSFTASAETFETVAKLMRAGAKRLPPKEKKPAQSMVKVASMTSVGDTTLVERTPAKSRQPTKINLPPVSKKPKSSNKESSNKALADKMKMKDKNYIPENLVGRV